MPTNTKHTPGPWRYRQITALSVYAFYIIDGDASLVAEVAMQSEAEEANARLIAAAPELADALEAALDALSNRAGWPEEEPTLVRARAALHKAGRLP